MKKIVVVLPMLFLVLNVTAQTWNEWFRQRKTQIRYLGDQISALRVYGATLKKGYDLVDAGLKGIGQFKQSDGIIHRDRFASLLLVRDGVKGSGLVHWLNMFQAAIQKTVNEYQKNCSKDNEFSSAERDDFFKVLGNIVAESQALGNEAILITSTGYYQMRDDERVKRLQLLYRNMEELYIFVRHVANDISITALSRMKERKEAKKVESLY